MADKDDDKHTKSRTDKGSSPVKRMDKGDIMLRVHPEVVKQLKANSGKWLQEMEEMSRKTILVKSDPSLHPEQFDIH